ncbi:MAG: winged helix-turn-helix domain-containing protein [Candidatus Competibacteraceae bacterium]|nr:winged helix-turn-helix domain-containing protein [Candidatus Competibacteraceae bacterium]
MPFPLTQEDIADALGLMNEGLFTLKHRALTILDHEGLRRLADFDAT